MTKRAKFVISSISLSLGFVAISTFENEYRFIGIGVLTVVAILVFVWSLSEGIGKNATLLSLVLPGFFTLAVGLFWFLLPSTPLTRLPVVIMYGIGIYALSLTTNIFTVSAIRTIALARAAKSVGFVLTLFTSFLLFDVILSLKAPIFVNAAVSAIVTFPLFLQGIWVSKLGHDLRLTAVVYSAVFSYGIGLLTAFLFFWPVTVVVGSLFLTMGVYVALGLGQASQEGRLFKQTIQEYLLVGTVVFIAMFFVTNWRG